MKLKNLLLVSVAILLGFNSCKKEDVDLIVGTWKYNTMDVKIETTDLEINKMLQANLATVKQLIDMTSVFKENDEYTATIYIPMQDSETHTGKYSLKDGKIYLDGEGIVYSLSKKSLTLKAAGTDFMNDFMADFMDGIMIDPALIIGPASITKFEISIKFDKK